MKVKLSLLTVFSVLVLLALMMPRNFTNLYVYGSPADSYGNDILYIEVWEGNTLKVNITTSSGVSVRVNASNTITFNVSMCLNSTLASSTSEAVSYTAVYMNVTGVWTNVELNNTSVVLNGNFYYLVEKGVLNAGTLTEGQSYDCSVLYKAYY